MLSNQDINSLLKRDDFKKISEWAEDFANQNHKIEIDGNIDNKIYGELLFHLTAQISQLNFLLENNTVVFFYPSVRAIFECVADFDFIFFQDKASVSHRVQAFTLYKQKKEHELNSDINGAKPVEAKDVWIKSIKKVWGNDFKLQDVNHWSGAKRGEITKDWDSSTYMSRFMATNSHSNYSTLQLMYLNKNDVTMLNSSLEYIRSILIELFTKVLADERSEILTVSQKLHSSFSELKGGDILILS